MVKRIRITQYRKLKNLDLDFNAHLNSISGTNGTCKTSVLHLVSNSVQAVNKSCDWIVNNECLKIISTINDVTNPKVETLTRGDKQYNDPAYGVKGTLLSVEYFDRSPLDFRRHNSSQTTRYCIKPYYQKGEHETLPFCPVIYLGLSRLVPYGELKNDDSVFGIGKKLPQAYQDEITKLYNSFTHYTISDIKNQKIGDMKTRAEFSSDKAGIDSNTISAGEDNLYILLTAIVSLRYYFESIESRNTVESILLVDELDATLHPAYQIKILQLFREYSERYKIQIIFTTHSMSTLEDMLAKKDKVIYLVDNLTNVVKMENPDIYQIKMHLSSLTSEDIYIDKVIPVFTEDNEARVLLDMLFSYFEERKPEFLGIRRFFHVVNVCLGAESLQDIFKDSALLRTTMKSICILDGDHSKDLSNNIMALPGGVSPEVLLFNYAKSLSDSDSDFWRETAVISKGYSKLFYIDHIFEPLRQYQEDKKNGTAKVKEREFNKKIFNDNKAFFEFLFKHWLHNSDNQSAIYNFYRDLQILFKKNARYNDINPDDWK